MILLRFIILAIVLVLLLRLARRALFLIEPSSPIRKVLLRFFPLLEYSIWFWLVFRAAELALSDYIYYNLVLNSMALAVVAVAGWYLLRDVWAGMLLKIENAIGKGQYIKTEFASGMIHQTGLRSLILETDNGEKIRIPYSRLSQAVVTQPAEEDSSHSHIIEMLVKRDNNAELIRKDITAQLLNMPWVIPGIPPQVTVKVHDENFFLAEIRFNVLKKDHVLQVEENIKGFSPTKS